ncbi:hypothetical protein HMI54_006540 [Coelomomyces lativittatus]|nr:hypothetical protein HMI56_007053 [Coelomomyces lativittatus]KAJ1517219.1 hypothetical protein HMI54_006540 [Coelomomyces lativittatus]
MNFLLNLYVFLAFIFFLQGLCIFSLPIYQSNVLGQKKSIHHSSLKWNSLLKNETPPSENPIKQKIDFSYEELRLTKRDSRFTPFRIDVKKDDASAQDSISLALIQGKTL